MVQVSNGIEITDGVDIERAKDTDFVLNTGFAGGMKIHEIKLFEKGGNLITISVFAGLQAYIQTYPHGLGYVPAYLAFKGYGDFNNPQFLTIPYNNYISVAGDSSFVNVDADNVIVGFDQFDADFIKVIIFEEKVADA